jgi:hypothetical protein
MRYLRITVGLFILLAFAAHAKAQKISTDYDPKANFSDYKTFTWIRPPTFRSDPLMTQRILDDVNAALTAKGWQEVSEGADVGIAAHVATRREHTLETFYNGFGGGWGWRHFWGGGLGEAVTVPRTYAVGTLVLDLFDAHTKQLIWRGMATDALTGNPTKDSARLAKAVQKLFKKFPPKRT